MIRNEVIEGLKILAQELNSSNIRWSLGASLMLALRGVNCTVDDIDLVIHEDDYDLLMGVLKKHTYVYMESNPKYQTKHFFSFVINDVDVDVMIDFRVKDEKGLYNYPFHVDDTIKIDDIDIPLASIEEWYQAYIHMGRDQKVKMIDNFRQNKKA